MRIITDDPIESKEDDAFNFSIYAQNLAGMIRDSSPKFAIGIFGGWGTGKTSLMHLIENELKQQDKNKILTVWFDAWRYEREKYVAIIPFLRLMSIALKERLEGDKENKEIWQKIREGLEKTTNAIIDSMDVTIGPDKSPVSATIHLQKIRDYLSSAGRVFIDEADTQLQPHVTDYLREKVEEIRHGPAHNNDVRIVVFIDDLDRCTPGRAVEVLESIKTFFDIEGIVFVIGMDSNSIDYIIEEKYGKKAKIKGIDYLQKIVQVPFQIPTWQQQIDLSEKIENIMKKMDADPGLIGPFNKNKELIAKAVQLNPREIKRFANNITLAKSVFKTSIDELIVVQALIFRPNWNRFLDLITPDELRNAFFSYYFTLKKKGEIPKSKEDLDKFIKGNSEAVGNTPMSGDVKQVFQQLSEQYDTLISFLGAGADTLLQGIRRMEDYRRILNTTRFEQANPNELSSSRQQVAKQSMVQEDSQFNDAYQT
jgi:hypothetical protein